MRSMGAAAVFETAAETPPTVSCVSRDLLLSDDPSSYRPRCGAPEVRYTDSAGDNR